MTLSLLGVGVGMVMVSAIVCVYYNVIVAWTLYFLYMSFRAVLPWSTCDNEWNTVNCVVDTGDRLPQPSPPTNATNSSSLSLTVPILLMVPCSTRQCLETCLPLCLPPEMLQQFCRARKCLLVKSFGREYTILSTRIHVSPFIVM